MTDLDPLELDRQIQRACSHWVTWRRQLRQGTGFSIDPFFFSNRLTSGDNFRAVSALPDADPVRDPLRRWLYRLLEQRANRQHIVQFFAGWHEPRPVEIPPRRERLSLSELIKRSLAEPAQRGIWLGAYFTHAEPVARSIIELQQRRRELSARLNVGSLESWLSPCENPKGAALALLEKTQAAYESLAIKTNGQYLAWAIGDPVREGWPARVTPATMRDLLGGDELFGDAELEPGQLPKSLGPASFGRALMRVGAAIVDARAPRDQPFCIAHDSMGLLRFKYGALLCSLLTNSPFLARRLGLGRAGAREYGRVLSAGWLLEARAAAFRALLTLAALEGHQKGEELLLEISEKFLKIELGSQAVGSWFKPREDALQRFLGLCMAQAQALSFLTEYDEDWFRNPRCIERFRDEAGSVPPLYLDADSTDRVLEQASSSLTELIAITN